MNRNGPSICETLCTLDVAPWSWPCSDALTSRVISPCEAGPDSPQKAMTGTPIIIAAAVHEVPKLIKLEKASKLAGHAPSAINLPLSLTAGAVAGVTAYLSVWFLMRWFKRHEVKGFDLYAYYCMAAGALFLTVEILAP